MHVRHTFLLLLLLLLLVLPPFIFALSPPKHRPPRSNDPNAKPSAHSDPSIIVPLYKEALKADAEGRPEDSLKLLSSPPLSLAPGILATSIRLYLKLRRWNEAEHAIRDASDRDALSLTYLAFLLARRCEFDASARLLLQIWEQGGGSDLTADRITHFLLLSFDSGLVRSWSRSNDEGVVSDIHDCTVGVSSCPEISPPLPAPAVCDRNWGEYSSGAQSRAVASTAATVRKLLQQSLLAQRRLSVNGNSSRAGAALTIITAANSLYFPCMGNMIGSLHAHEPEVNVVIYDLGMDPLQRQVARSWRQVQVIPAPLGPPLPPHVSNLRHYAWKPIIMRHALRRFGTFFYEDAGQEIRGGLGPVLRLIKRDGYFYVTQGEKTLANQTHAGTMRAMGSSSAEMRGRDMCAGGIQGYRAGSRIAEEVLSQVIGCVSNRECVAPDGADQSNHRFDQSVFSVVLARMHIRCHNNWKFNGYLEEDRLHEADRWDVDNGFGREKPLVFSRRCGPGQVFVPQFRN